MLPRKPRQLPLRATNTPDEGERGVFCDIDALSGTEAFNIYDSTGRRLGRWEAVQGVTDENLLDAFDALLERREPRLHLILPSQPRAS